MQIILNDQGYINNYALIGGLVDGIEIEVSDDLLGDFKQHPEAYKLEDGVLVLDADKLKEFQNAKLLAQQLDKQNENNGLLVAYLKDHPIRWKDGKYYGVTQEDQSEIALNLTQYQLAVTAGLSPSLEWHALHEQCREFTVEELSALALSISAYVYPLVRYNQSIKTTIYATTTVEELEKIIIDYEKVGVTNESSK